MHGAGLCADRVAISVFAARTMRAKRYVIVGDGAAGMTAARTLRHGDGAAEIVVVSDDPHPAYYRAALTNYLLGELRDEQLWATTPSFYAQYRIERVLARSTALVPDRRELWVSHGWPIVYDDLLIATGARARMLPFHGAVPRGVMTLRTLMDARSVTERLAERSVREAVIVGGGSLGLEWALGLHAHGVQVTLVIRGRTMMQGALDQVGSDLLIARLRQAGINVLLENQVATPVAGRNAELVGVALKSGHTVPCQLLGLAIGIVPNVEFLKQSSIRLGASGGVVVDARQRTSSPNVYAAGDVAEVAGAILGLWEPAQRQAKIAAANMLNRPIAYEPGCHYLATRLFDLDFASVGKTDVDPRAGLRVVVDFPRGTGKIAYRKLVFDGPCLTGALMLGARQERVRVHGRLFKRLIDRRVDVSAVAHELLDRGFDLRAWLERQVVAAPGIPARALGAAGAGGLAQVKRTQAIHVSTLAPGPSIHLAAPPRTAAALLGTQVLSAFNLRPAQLSAAAGAPSGGAAGAARTSVLAWGAPREPVTLELDGRALRFTSDLIALGRGPQNDVVLADPAVDFAHAHIQAHADDYYLRDLGSRGGTWVNQQAVVVPHRLRSGDRLRLGRTEITFRSAEASRLSAAAPAQPPARRAVDGPPRLEMRSGQALGVSFALTRSPCSVGSDPAADVFLSDYSVLPRHAELYRDAAGWVLRPGTAGAATAHRGRWLTAGEAVLLQDGDALQLGAMELVFSTGPSPGAFEWASRDAAPAQASPSRSAPSASGTSERRVELLPAVPGPGAAPVAAASRYVRVLQGPGAGQRHAVGEWLAIGSAPSPAGFKLADPSLFPTELELRTHEGRLFARNVAAPGRSFHNGVPLTDQYVVCSAGDRFQLGPHVVLALEEGP